MIVTALSLVLSDSTRLLEVFVHTYIHIYYVYTNCVDLILSKQTDRTEYRPSYTTDEYIAGDIRKGQRKNIFKVNIDFLEYFSSYFFSSNIHQLVSIESICNVFRVITLRHRSVQIYALSRIVEMLPSEHSDTNHVRINTNWTYFGYQSLWMNYHELCSQNNIRRAAYDNIIRRPELVIVYDCMYLDSQSDSHVKIVKINQVQIPLNIRRLIQ